MTYRNQIRPAPIHKTVKEAVDIVLKDPSWAQDYFVAKKYRQIIKDRDGGYFIEGEDGSPPLGHPRALQGGATAFIEPQHIQDRATYTFSFIGFSIRIYESNNDGTMPSGKLFWENGVLTPVPEPIVVLNQQASHPRDTSKEREKREEEERRYQAKRDQYIAEGACYFLCYFRQIEDTWGGSRMEISFVSPETFPGDSQHLADKRADELEQERYKKNDYNLRIVARLARSLEDAKAGIFLDS